MIKLKYLVSEQTGAVLKQMMAMKMDTPEFVPIVKLVREIEQQFGVVRPVHARLFPLGEDKKPTEGTPEAQAEWAKYLETDVPVEKLPLAVKAVLKGITPVEWISVENLFEDEPAAPAAQPAKGLNVVK